MATAGNDDEGLIPLWWRRWGWTLVTIFVLIVSIIVGFSALVAGYYRQQKIPEARSAATVMTSGLKPENSAHSDTAPAFGPAFELELNSGLQIDFDGNWLRELPEFHQVEGHEPVRVTPAESVALAWKTSAADKTDACYSEGKLLSFGMKVEPVTTAEWDVMQPHEVGNRVQASRPHPLEPRILSEAGLVSLFTGNAGQAFAFETREGGRGLMVIDSMNRASIKLRYKLVKAGSATTASATDEIWSPTLSPGAKPDLDQIYVEAQRLRERGRYDEALQRHLWLHHQGLETNPNHSAVRLSFWLSEWADLGRRYPKAKQALIETRDHGASEIVAGRGDFALFMEVDRINGYLQDQDATFTLFKRLERVDKALAGQCYPLVEDRLMERGEFEACLTYIGDPLAHFEDSRKALERSQKPPGTAPNPSSDSLRAAESERFVTNTCHLIKILVGLHRIPEAEKIRDQAVAILGDSLLKSAITDAEKDVGRQPIAPSTKASPSKPGQSPAATPVLQLRWVVDASSDQTEEMVLVGSGARGGPLETLHVQKTVLLDQSILKTATVVRDEQLGTPVIELQLTESGSQRFAIVSRAGKGRRLAIIIGGQLYSAPMIREEIAGGRVVISGNFSEKEATGLVERIQRSVPAH
jgi:hypothetical protein